MEAIERKAERNAAIFAAWLDGKSFADIGREYDITRQRAGQLVRIEAKRQLAGVVDTLAEVRLYAEKMLRSGDGNTRIHGADLLAIIDREWGQ
jgi:hypothetical protein